MTTISAPRITFADNLKATPQQQPKKFPKEHWPISIEIAFEDLKLAPLLKGDSASVLYFLPEPVSESEPEPELKPKKLRGIKQAFISIAKPLKIRSKKNQGAGTKNIRPFAHIKNPFKKATTAQ